MIAKQRVCSAATAISILVLALDAPMVFYWSRVQLAKSKYEPAEFAFQELRIANTGPKGRRLLAYGLVDGNEESFSSWRDFGSQIFLERKPKGEKWAIYYDQSAPRFDLYGRTLRVVSRHEFETKGISLAWHLLVVCLPSVSVLGVSLAQLRRANQGKSR